MAWFGSLCSPCSITEALKTSEAGVPTLGTARSAKEKFRGLGPCKDKELMVPRPQFHKGLWGLGRHKP